MTRVDLVYFNAGGGHRAAALALQQVIAEQQRGWSVRLVNLMEAIDPRSRFQKLTGMAPEDLYNQRLARGWTLGLAQELKVLQAMIRLGHRSLVRALEAHWAAAPSDLVVSLVPNFNRALCESVASALPGAPFVTVMTDMADHPPHFWIEPGQRQHLVCGTPFAASQARAAGYRDDQISLTSGMILRPDFHRAPHIDREQECAALGLDPKRPIGIVMFGGQGSMQMVGIAKALADVQLVLLCGHNAPLARKLRAVDAGTSAESGATHAVLGFTTEIPRYLQLGDFFIGKPGPGSLSEAVQMGLPVVTFCNAWTMPQERYNTRWVTEQGVGVVVRSTRSMRAAVLDMLASLGEYRARARGLRNRAVFEVPDILAGLLDAAALSRQQRVRAA